jgi:hypothetical protein
VLPTLPTPLRSLDLRVIHREADLIESGDAFIKLLKAHLAKPETTYPQELLRRGNPNEAVTMIFTLFEGMLAKRAGQMRTQPSITRLIEWADQSGMLLPGESDRLRAWFRLHNHVVYTSDAIDVDTARRAVNGMEALIIRVESHDDA